MKVGYAKLGRSMLLDPDKWGPVGGDNEPLLLLNRLARTYPNDEFVIVGRHGGGENAAVEKNVTVPELKKTKDWNEAADDVAQHYEDLDAIVVWAGQHGTSNQPIRKTNGSNDVTSPQEAFLRYSAPIVRGINKWRDADPSREEVWLHPDPRNYIKARDLKWPLQQPMLGQYEWSRKQRHYRWEDPQDPDGWPAEWDPDLPGVWMAEHRYIYSQLEIVGIPDAWDGAGAGFNDRHHFGILVNEARSYVKLNRADIVADWVMPLKPVLMAGKWSETGLQKLGLEAIDPIHHADVPGILGMVKSTFTTPSSGSKWATTKPWESFALGAVCFFHPDYDSQGHIIPTLEQVEAGIVQDSDLEHLARWLRVRTPEELASRVAAVRDSEETYTWLTEMQRSLYKKAVSLQLCMNTIAERTGLK